MNINSCGVRQINTILQCNVIWKGNKNLKEATLWRNINYMFDKWGKRVIAK